MTQTGGPAAINGFLYQILHHLDWLSDVRLMGTLDGQDVKDGCLVLEPRDGGDAQAHASGLFLVEQYKTRSVGTWSLGNLTAVLRDLRNSVTDSRPEHGRYRFVTDGRAGQLGAFESFVARLDESEGPDDLDDDTKRRFTRTLCRGDREFLDHLVVATRSTGDGGPTAEERETVFHLLGRFEMKFCVRSEELAKAVEARLRPYVHNLGAETGVRQRLIGVLMERLGAGETRLDSDGLHAMLRAAEVVPDRLRKVLDLARKLEDGMRCRSRYLRYRRCKDVRDVPRWPKTKPVLVIGGNSGAGKSWQLARLVEEGVGEGEPIVFVRGNGSAEEILRRAADEIWQVAMGETSDRRLQAISNFFREDAFQLRPPLYTVAVDDVQSIDAARSLVRQDWTSLGARLVLTAPSYSGPRAGCDGPRGDLAASRGRLLHRPARYLAQDARPSLGRSGGGPEAIAPQAGSRRSFPGSFRYIVSGRAAERVRDFPGILESNFREVRCGR